MNAEIEALEAQLVELSQKLSAARRNAAPESVRDYELRRANGAPVRLSELFASKSDLILIHNMGKSCPYCTLWADGFNGEREHLADRAGFALASPDEPDVLREFAQSRGWLFPTVSFAGTSFAADLGFEKNGRAQPGVSTFRMCDNGAIERVGKASFGPGDPYCGVWHLFDLLDGGAKDWAPKYKYE